MMQQSNWRERLQSSGGREVDLLRRQELDRKQALALKNRRTGINLFQVSWIMAFVCLSVVNIQMRTSVPVWPPPGVEKLDPILPTLATIGLLISIYFTQRALKALQSDDVKSFLVQWRTTLGLGGLFVAVIMFEWLTLKPVPDGVVQLLSGVEITTAISQYNTIFRVMTGFHLVHALVIGGYMLWVQRRATAGLYGSRDSWDVEAGAKLWYFVVIAWIMFYVVLYLI